MLEAQVECVTAGFEVFTVGDGRDVGDAHHIGIFAIIGVVVGNACDTREAECRIESLCMLIRDAHFEFDSAHLEVVGLFDEPEQE